MMEDQYFFMVNHHEFTEGSGMISLKLVTDKVQHSYDQNKLAEERDLINSGLSKMLDQHTSFRKNDKKQQRLF